MITGPRNIADNPRIPKLKVCGMKHNTPAIAELGPDYLGFIFWEGSRRHFEGILPSIPRGIKKTGVFVDAPIPFVLEKMERCPLDALQLHGAESPAYCEALQRELRAKPGKYIEVIKAFSLKDTFDFDKLGPYVSYCDYFLFDTKGKLPGGNGYTFDWNLLADYPFKKPFFLSGGIGLDEISSIQRFLQRKESEYCYAIDVNSKFEERPGLKRVKAVAEFQDKLKNPSERTDI